MWRTILYKLGFVTKAQYESEVKALKDSVWSMHKQLTKS